MRIPLGTWSRVSFCHLFVICDDGGDGGRWVTFEGTCSVTNDTEICTDAVSRYAVRYSPPKDRGSDRRTITMVVSKILLSAGLASSH